MFEKDSKIIQVWHEKNAEISLISLLFLKKVLKY